MNEVNLINEFKSMLASNKYITFKEYNSFLDKIIKLNNYNESLKEIINNGFTYIDKHNSKYIDKKLIENKAYFDNMFKNIDNSIVLDTEQRKAILNEEDYSLIIAGAGAGKTTTMAAKVKYLIEKCNVNPEQIAVISYTNKATEELEDRIKFEFNLPVNIMTFHSLGIKIIRKLFKEPLKPAAEKEKKEIICNYIKNELFANKKLLDDYVETFNKYLNSYYPMFSKGFVANYKKFNTFDEYFTDYKIRKQNENKDNLENIINYRINNYLNAEHPKSLKNEIMRSRAEAKIANFLFMNGIDYKYEEPYPEKVDADKAYLPDFTIEVNGIPIYIEYYGLSSIYKNNTLKEKDAKKYHYIREKKRQFHKLKNNNYIELDYKIERNGTTINYLQDLYNKLKEHNVTFKKRTNEEIYDQILDNNIQAEFFRFVNFSYNLIGKIKSSINREHINQVIQNYINNISNEYQIKENLANEANLFIKLYNYYQKELSNRKEIDFADMIYYANKYINNLENSTTLNYKYLIIDEYQDISSERYLFAKNISNIMNSKVISVGDDWQAIFSFAGSRIDLFYEYISKFPGAKQLFINSTYRNSQELINLAGSFIMKNPIQIKKYLNSNKNCEDPIKICYYNNNQYDIVENIIERIYKKDNKAHIMILARKNKHLKHLCESNLFTNGIDTRIICNKYPNAYIDAMSIHKAKGLSADYVIILNATNNDFPTQEKDNIWLFDLFKPDTYNENFPYAEDRRIFYVALTRTKNEVYILTPIKIENRSPFIEEIYNIKTS